MHVGFAYPSNQPQPSRYSPAPEFADRQIIQKMP